MQQWIDVSRGAGRKAVATIMDRSTCQCLQCQARRANQQEKARALTARKAMRRALRAGKGA